MLSPAALDDLRAYAWPGNVRELQNCIERAVILCDADTILPRHLNLSFRPPAAAGRDSVAPPVVTSTDPWDQVDLSGSMNEAVRRAIAEVERRKVEQALKESGGNKHRAAEMLQVSYKALLQKQKEHRIVDEPA
jgi:DNA-binding NtrC family response regulator